jgi:hypothetical protein
LFKAGVGGPAEPGLVALFDVGDNPVAGAHSLPTSFGGHDEFGAPVGWVVGPIYVAEVLQLVDYGGDRLFVPPRYPGQIRQPDAVFVEVGQHRAVARAQVVKALFRGAAEELALQAEEKPGGNVGQSKFWTIR